MVFQPSKRVQLIADLQSLRQREGLTADRLWACSTLLEVGGGSEQPIDVDLARFISLVESLPVPQKNRDALRAAYGLMAGTESLPSLEKRHEAYGARIERGPDTLTNREDVAIEELANRLLAAYDARTPLLAALPASTSRGARPQEKPDVHATVSADATGLAITGGSQLSVAAGSLQELVRRNLATAYRKEFDESVGVFVPLDGVRPMARTKDDASDETAFPDGKRDPRESGGVRYSPPRPLDDIYDDLTDGFFLIGEPGSGKTTSLRGLALRQVSVLEQDESASIPIYLDLQLYGSFDSAAGLVEELERRLFRLASANADLVKALEGHAFHALGESGSTFVFFLDGLDTLAGGIQWIREFVVERGDDRFVLSVRPSTRNVFGLEPVELAGLESAEEQVEFLVYYEARDHGCLGDEGRESPCDECRQSASALHSELRRHALSSSLLGNPLRLSMARTLHKEGKLKPDAQLADLYGLFAEHLLTEPGMWRSADGQYPLSREDVRSVLDTVLPAYYFWNYVGRLLAAGPGGDPRDLSHWMLEGSHIHDWDKLLERTCIHTRLLHRAPFPSAASEDAGLACSFLPAHQTFAEYFAASYLFNRGDSSNRLKSALAGARLYAVPDSVLLFLADLVSSVSDRSRRAGATTRSLWALVRMVARHRSSLTAAQCIGQCGDEKVRRSLTRRLLLFGRAFMPDGSVDELLVAAGDWDDGIFLFRRIGGPGFAAALAGGLPPDRLGELLPWVSTHSHSPAVIGTARALAQRWPADRADELLGGSGRVQGLAGAVAAEELIKRTRPMSDQSFDSVAKHGMTVECLPHPAGDQHFETMAKQPESQEAVESALVTSIPAPVLTQEEADNYDAVRKLEVLAQVLPPERLGELLPLIIPFDKYFAASAAARELARRFPAEGLDELLSWVVENDECAVALVAAGELAWRLPAERLGELVVAVMKNAHNPDSQNAIEVLTLRWPAERLDELLSWVQANKDSYGARACAELLVQGVPAERLDELLSWVAMNADSYAGWGCAVSLAQRLPEERLGELIALVRRRPNSGAAMGARSGLAERWGSSRSN